MARKKPIGDEGRAALQRVNEARLDAEPKPIYTKEQSRDQMQKLAHILADGVVNTARIQHILGEAGVFLTKSRIEKLKEKVQELWHETDAFELKNAKYQQLHRLRGHLAMAREQEHLPAIAKFETLIGNIQGTFAPIEVDHRHHMDIQQTVVNVISSLGAEEMQGMLVEYQEKENLAKQYQQDRLLAASPKKDAAE